MRKARVFAVLAFFLAVSAVSTIHAASYPSDAPLPRFEITKMSGNNAWGGVMIRFEGALVNYQEVKNWFVSHGYVCTWMGFFFIYSSGGNDWGEEIAVNPDGAINIPLTRYTETVNYGKWITPSFFRVQVDSGYFTFDVPVSLGYSVYVSHPYELPEGVWTDLQFRQTNVIPDFDYRIFLVALVVVVLVLAAVARKKH